MCTPGSREERHFKLYSDSAHVACYIKSSLTTANTCVRVSVVSGVVCWIFTISADPVDTAEDMHAKGLSMSVACVGSVFVEVLACVRARVTVVCRPSYNQRLCVIDVITNFRTFLSLATSVFLIRFSLTIPN